MNYLTIKNIDIANGPGIRVSLFVSGCTHHCMGCFNPESWDFVNGEPFTIDVENYLLAALGKEFVKGISLLGGEPFENANRPALIPFLRRFKDKFPYKDVWAYSGYQYEYLKDNAMDLLAFVDVLVDGEFILAQRDLGLRFRGSSNQRIIDVKKSIEKNNIVLWED